MEKIELEDLKKIQEFKNQCDIELQTLKLKIENITLQFENVILRTHIKYNIANEQYIDLETGKILNKKEKEDVK